MKKILVIDDELSMREVLKILLEKEGYSVTTAQDASIALGLLGKHSFDLIIFSRRSSPKISSPRSDRKSVV